MTPAQQSPLKQLLKQFKTFFGTNPGRTTAVWHIIETAAGQVVQTTHRPVPWKHWKTINHKVSKMLKMDIIEPSTSTCCNPIVLVPKLDGSVRICIDFHDVNKLAAFDAYPMPCPDVLLSQLGGHASSVPWISPRDIGKSPSDRRIKRRQPLPPRRDCFSSRKCHSAYMAQLPHSKD